MFTFNNKWFKGACIVAFLLGCQVGGYAQAKLTPADYEFLSQVQVNDEVSLNKIQGLHQQIKEVGSIISAKIALNPSKYPYGQYEDADFPVEVAQINALKEQIAQVKYQATLAKERARQ